MSGATLAARAVTADAGTCDAGEVELDYEARYRRRFAMRSTTGVDFLLDLARARRLRDGEGLVLDDGRVVRVRAQPEALLEVRGRDAEHLVRLAWHVGNRHLPAELFEGVIYIRADHVIADMLRGLGAVITDVERPFDPEPGAYAGHGHEHA